MTAPQWTREQIAEAAARGDHRGILAAKSAGLLNEAMGLPAPPSTTGQPTESDLAHMSSQQIMAARRRGELDHLLDPTQRKDV